MADIAELRSIDKFQWQKGLHLISSSDEIGSKDNNCPRITVLNLITARSF